MTVAERSAILNLAKWSLDKLTAYYPEQSLSSRDIERVEKLAAIWKRWVTHEPETPQLAFHRACDILGLEPDEVREVLRRL